MIKKILLSLGLIGFGLISFTNGEFIDRGETVFIDDNERKTTVVSILNGLTDDGNFYNKGMVSLWHHNDFGNYSHQLFFHDNKIYFNHSLGNNSLNVQGYITNWKICNLDEDDYYITGAVNCQGNYDTPINLNDIHQVDAIFIYNWIISNIDNPSSVCFIDKSQNKSFCVSCHRNNCPSGYTPGNLINNNNYYDENAIYELGEDIFSGGGGVSSSNSIDYTCTKEIALKWYEKNGYSSKLCYGGFDNFNLFTGAVNDLPFYGSGLDIDEIWFNTAQYRIYGDIGSGMGYNDWFHYWRLVYNSYYRTVNEGGVLVNPFNNTPLVLFTYFSAVNQFGRNLKDKDILEYCDLKLYTSDYSAVYSGNYGDKVCSPLVWLEESINNLNSSGNVNVGVNIGFGFSGSGNSGQNFADGQSFIQSFVKFIDSDKFEGTNTGSNGIIPGYIVLVLCALLLFRFLMH